MTDELTPDDLTPDDLTPDDLIESSPYAPAAPPAAPPPGPSAAPPTGDTAVGASVPPGAADAPTSPPEDQWFAADPAAPARADGAPRRMRTWVAAGVGAAVIAVGSVAGIGLASSHSSSSASTLQGQGPGAAGGRAGIAGGGGRAGTVVSVSGSTLVMRAPTRGSSTTKPVTVKTTSSTRITEAVTGSVSQIETGDHLVITGTTSGTEVAATQIEDRGTAALAAGGPGGAPPAGASAGSRSSTQGAPAGAPGGSGTERPPAFAGGTGGPPGMGAGGGFGGGAPVTGTVTAVDGSTLTVKSTAGTTYTVTASSSTTVAVDKTITLAELSAGETVVVDGTTSGSVLTATSIRAGTAGFGAGARPGQAAGS